MVDDVQVIDVTLDNVDEVGCSCFMKADDQAHLDKIDWFKKRTKEGMKIKILKHKNEKKSIGYIEYTKGENAWRAVEAKDYLVVHCIWVSPNKYKEKGYGSLLLSEAINDAEKEGKLGVVAVVSESSFMANKDLFLNNKFESISNEKPFDLMVLSLKKGSLPVFIDTGKQLEKLKGLNAIYTKQCPWVLRLISEIKDVCSEFGFDITVKELESPKDVQKYSPSIYASFSLVYDGKLLADHYISATRLKNILKKLKK